MFLSGGPSPAYSKPGSNNTQHTNFSLALDS